MNETMLQKIKDGLVGQSTLGLDDKQKKSLFAEIDKAWQEIEDAEKHDKAEWKALSHDERILVLMELDMSESEAEEIETDNIDGLPDKIKEYVQKCSRFDRGEYALSGPPELAASILSLPLDSRGDFMNIHKGEGMQSPHELKIQFANEKALKHFAGWLSGAGEQDYWQWMEYREQEEKGDITALNFKYRKGSGELFLGDNTIRTELGRLDDGAEQRRKDFLEWKMERDRELEVDEDEEYDEAKYGKSSNGDDDALRDSLRKGFESVKEADKKEADRIKNIKGDAE